MSRNRFLPGTRFQILNEENVWVWHEIDQVLINDNFSLVNISSGGAYADSHAHLLELYFQERLRFEIKGRAAHKDPNEQLSFEHEYGDFSVIPEKYRIEAWRRYELIIPILRLKKPVSNDYLDDYVKKIKEDAKYQDIPKPDKDKPRKGRPLGMALSRSSIRLWISNYKLSGFSVHGLYPYYKNSKNEPTHRLQNEVDDAIDAVLETYNAKRDSAPPNFRIVDDITTDVILAVNDLNDSLPTGEKLPYPHPNTIRNRIKEYGLVALIHTRKKRGEAMDIDNPVYESERATRINEIHEYDGTELGFIAIDESDGYPVGRASFLGGVDDLTGYPTGWRYSFEPLNSKLVADTMMASILPKPDFISLYGTQHNCESYGLMEIAKYDNGGEFLNQSEIDACGDNGITFLQCPTHSPQLKGGIERYIRTHGENYIERVSGATFNYMFNTRDFNPTDYSCIGLSKLLALSHHYVLDQYTQIWQEARKGTPASLWRENISKGFLPCLPDSIRSLKISFFRSTTRTLQRYGIEIDTLIYQSRDTARLKSILNHEDQTVLVKINPYDISYIYILDPITQRDWLRFDANDQEYTKGLSIWKHNVIREYTRIKMGLEVNIINLAKSKKHIREVVQSEFQRVKSLQKGRRRAAAYLYERDPNNFIKLAEVEHKSQSTVLLPHTSIYDYSYNDKPDTKPQAPSPAASISTPQEAPRVAPLIINNVPPVKDPPKGNLEQPKQNDGDDDLEIWSGGVKSWPQK